MQDPLHNTRMAARRKEAHLPYRARAAIPENGRGRRFTQQIFWLLKYQRHDLINFQVKKRNLFNINLEVFYLFYRNLCFSQNPHHHEEVPTKPVIRRSFGDLMDREFCLNNTESHPPLQNVTETFKKLFLGCIPSYHSEAS